MTDLHDVVRVAAPQALAALVRRHGDFDAAEDAVQEALVAATTQWPQQGVPDNPVGWLVRVAQRRLLDRLRRERSRVDRELRYTSAVPGDELTGPPADADRSHDGIVDDTVALLVLCCHPALTRATQVALTLRAVGGLTTAQIASAFLVPEATMGQRISRAKSRLRESGARFTPPAPDDVPERVGAVLQVLYLLFNEGYATSGGAELRDVALSSEAIRLTRMLHSQFPLRGDRTEVAGEVAGLLALMLLTEARAPARTRPDGSLVPLAEQARELWDRDLIAEGTGLVERALTSTALGPLQVQAAIAAIHAEAKSWDDTDWLQILILYRTLDRLAPSPMVTLNLAVATAMVHGPASGLRTLEPLLADPRLQRHHRLHAVRAHLLEQAGLREAAADSYAAAARLTTSMPEQRYLNDRRARLEEGTRG